EVLRRDKEERRIQMDFPEPRWTAILADIRRQLGYVPVVRFPIAKTFAEKNGHCFFGWYTATIRGNGDLYPCCLLMFPDYKPLGNALNGRFVDQWNGPAFTRMRQEQRDVFLAGESAAFDPKKFKVLLPQCVEHGQCFLKNLFFRGDEAFYKELGEALDGARRSPGTRLRLAVEPLWLRLRSAAGRALPRTSRLGSFVRRIAMPGAFR